MNRRTAAKIALTTLGTMTMLTHPAWTSRADEAHPLAPWRWKSRLLLVFAPFDSDARLIAQRERLAAADSQLTERDLVVIDVIGEHADHNINGASLRSRYRVHADQFEVILIGKDGGEKLRRAQPMDADTLFGVIDSMPMRRSEAAKR